jgi:hypothetical protein
VTCCGSSKSETNRLFVQRSNGYRVTARSYGIDCDAHNVPARQQSIHHEDAAIWHSDAKVVIVSNSNSMRAALSRSIMLRFDLNAGGEPEFVNIHKIRNFAEALSLELDRSELGSLPMDEADRATTQVRITEIRKRNLRRCLALVDELLDQHFMKDGTDVHVEDQVSGIDS